MQKPNTHHLQEILKKVPDIYSPNLEESEPTSQATGAGGGGFMYRGLLRVSLLLIFSAVSNFVSIVESTKTVAKL